MSSCLIFRMGSVVIKRYHDNYLCMLGFEIVVSVNVICGSPELNSGLNFRLLSLNSVLCFPEHWCNLIPILWEASSAGDYLRIPPSTGCHNTLWGGWPS